MKRGFEHEVPFVSQREHGPRRWRECGCGVASLMMLLKHRNLSAKQSIFLPSYSDLGAALEVKFDAHQKMA
jgi:hypothetical protein